ncbi:MAG: hypothetical protein IPM97_08220 [Bdellovibrionaceae bacterium]|nr:hypothetical protein [Pseudobdellovibrionaceae bacterium]
MSKPEVVIALYRPKMEKPKNETLVQKHFPILKEYGPHHRQRTIHRSSD